MVPIRDQGWGKNTSDQIDAYNEAMGYDPRNPLATYLAGGGAASAGVGGFYPGAYGGGRVPANSGGGGMDLNALLAANQYGSFLGFPGAMQGAMAQMGGVNAANQQASLYAKALQAQLQAMLGTAAYGAYGDIGSAHVGRLTQNDYLNNPLIAEQIRGNLGTSIAQIQNKGVLDAINAKGAIARDLFGSFMGGAGGFGRGGGGLRGFEATDGSGMKAMLPTQSSGSPIQQPATTGYAQVPAQPVTPQAPAPMQGGVQTPNYFARQQPRQPVNTGLDQSMQYVMDYLARGGR